MKLSARLLPGLVVLAATLAVGPVAAQADKAQPQQLPPGHPPMGAAAKPATPVDLKGIKKAPGGMTVQEIITGAKGLNGKKVTVRGRVTKVLPEIMGKNWVHLGDGSGADGKADLTITTKSMVKVGDLVLATGTIAANKDFGSGYKYDVIMEDASFKVE
jgi:hypothetical protein